MAKRELSDARPDGTSLGQSASDLVGFYGATPVVQPTSASQAAVTATAVTAVATTAATATTTTYGYTTGTQANAIRARVNQAVTDIGNLTTLVNQLRTELVALGLITGS